MMKRAQEDEPYIDNYPPLRDWLRKHEMRCHEQIRVGGTKNNPDALIECWYARGAITPVWVVVRANKMGWDLLTGVATNSIPETLADAEQRMGLPEVAQAREALEKA